MCAGGVWLVYRRPGDSEAYAVVGPHEPAAAAVTVLASADRYERRPVAVAVVAVGNAAGAFVGNVSHAGAPWSITSADSAS